MNTNTDTSAMLKRLVIVSAGSSDPSSTRMLADRIASSTRRILGEQGSAVEVRVIDLRTMATDIASALVTQHLSPELQDASDALLKADGIVAATPIFKAGASGLFTSFFQALDNDLLIGKPVVLAATAGSARHALVIDDQIRGLFAYLRTVSAPTSIFAAPDDWNSPELGKRIERAATELALLIASGFSSKIREQSWGSYQHALGSAGGSETDIDLDSELMRLATGG